MSFLQTLAAAFKGGASARVPLARTFTSPWLFAEGSARAPFEYNGAVKRAYLDNPVAQRAVRLVAEGATGVWSGHAGEVASFQQGQWLFQPPRDGLRLFNRATGQELLHSGTWKARAKPALPTGGAVTDMQARAAIAALIDSLVTAGVLPTM